MNSARSAALGLVVLRICWQLPALGAAGLREAEVQADAAAAANPVQDAVDHAPSTLVLVEAQRLEVVHVARGLRDRKRVYVLHVARERIGIADVVGVRMPQERDEIARGGESEPGHQRVFRRERK